MAYKKKKRKRRRRRLKPFVIPMFAGILVAIIALVVILAVSCSHRADAEGSSRNPANAATDTATNPSTDAAGENGSESSSDEAAIVEPEVISQITVGSTGDILIHPMVLNAFDTGDGHNFTGAFTSIAPYYSDLDLMVANLEVPLVDPADGYAYSANPFASPDAVAEALKWAGVDVCLTANNHTYDMGSYGMHRTQDVLSSLGLEYTGTKQSPSDSYILAKEVGGVKLGMICYTYETGGGDWYSKSLNYIPISDDDTEMVNTFNYNDLDTFYADAEKQLKEMEAAGCDLSIFYLHWGEEYQDEPNDLQTEIARHLCDLGVDVIVGGHPHVVQKFDVLKSANGHEMLCLYSMGNELSNQRREYMNEDDYRGYTEDGVVFILTIDKYNTGETKISAIDVLPTWVEREDSFEIIPLDYKTDVASWPGYDTALQVESYNRTIGRLGDAYIAFRKDHGQPDIPLELSY